MNDGEKQPVPWTPLAYSAVAMATGVLLFVMSVAPPHPVGWTKPVALFFVVTGAILYFASIVKCWRYRR